MKTAKIGKVYPATHLTQDMYEILLKYNLITLVYIGEDLYLSWKNIDLPVL